MFQVYILKRNLFKKENGRPEEDHLGEYSLRETLIQAMSRLGTQGPYGAQAAVLPGHPDERYLEDDGAPSWERCAQRAAELESMRGRRPPCLEVGGPSPAGM